MIKCVENKGDQMPSIAWHRILKRILVSMAEEDRKGSSCVDCGASWLAWLVYGLLTTGCRALTQSIT